MGSECSVKWTLWLSPNPHGPLHLLKWQADVWPAHVCVLGSYLCSATDTPGLARHPD